jgi:hypothetical protein
LWTTRAGVPRRKTRSVMPESPDRPHRIGVGYVDLVIAVSAVIISVASLWVALRADRTQEALLQSNVWPYIEYDTSDATPAGTNRLAYEVTNAGVGPAIVRNFSVAYNEHYFSTLDELLRVCCSYDRKVRHGILDSTVRDRVIMPHETVQFILVLPKMIDTRTYHLISLARQYVSVRICYCSVLGECWLLDSSADNQPHPVGQCTPGQMPQYTT